MKEAQKFVAMIEDQAHKSREEEQADDQARKSHHKAEEARRQFPEHHAPPNIIAEAKRDQAERETLGKAVRNITGKELRLVKNQIKAVRQDYSAKKAAFEKAAKEEVAATKAAEEI